MRGSDELTGSMFSYVNIEARIPANHPIRIIRRVVNEVLAGLDAEFTAMYSGIGRPSIAPERLLRGSLMGCRRLPAIHRVTLRQAGPKQRRHRRPRIKLQSRQPQPSQPKPRTPRRLEAFSLGTKLFSEAQALTSVPSTVKCASESSGATRACSRMPFRNLRAISASSRRPAV